MIKLVWKIIVIIEGELDYIDIDDVGKLEDLLRAVFNDEACGNLKVVIDHQELTRQEHFFNKQVEYCESVR